MNKDVENIIDGLLIKYPFFGSVIAGTKIIENNDCSSNGIPTAATDGECIYYHKEVLKHSEDELKFMFAHEICHIAFDHINRSENKDKEVWNIATDAVINAFLKKDGLKLINGVVDMPEAINYDAEELYDTLIKKKNESNENKTNNQNENNDSSNQSENHKGPNNHEMWEDKIKEKNSKNGSSDSQNGKSDNSEQTGNENNQNNENSKDKEKDKNNTNKERSNSNNQTGKSNSDKQKNNNVKEDIERNKRMGERKVFEQNRIERKKQLEELRDSLAKQMTGAGSTTNENELKIENIGVAKPLISWSRLLKENINFNVDWSYKNATIEDGVLTSHLEYLPSPLTEILLDTSGSISETLLKNFLRDCKNILMTSKVKAGCFDTKFYGFYPIRNLNDIDNMPFKGGGGTDFDVAVNAFSKRVENKIIFTDGYASLPEKYLNAIWVVFGESDFHPKGGKVIYINEEELRRLKLRR